MQDSPTHLGTLFFLKRGQFREESVKRCCTDESLQRERGRAGTRLRGKGGSWAPWVNQLCPAQRAPIFQSVLDMLCTNWAKRGLEVRKFDTSKYVSGGSGPQALMVEAAGRNPHPGMTPSSPVY